MSERKEGWYWVMPDKEKSDEWECAEWDGDNWNVTCTDREWPECYIDEVGPRIPTPDEAPPIGTQYRDESGAVVTVVAPVRPDSAMIEAGHFAPAGIYGTGVVRCVEHYRQMLAALPEPD